MKRNKFARISPEEMQKRVLSLETLLGQKNLASALGVSKDTERRYRNGSSFPKTKDIYNKINRLYNSKKKLISPIEVEKKRAAIAKRAAALKKGKLKTRYVPIYPDYMYNSPAEQFDGVYNWEKLEELSEKGYIAGYKGFNEIPLEVQFTIGQEPLTRFGKIVHIVGIITQETSPKKENEFTGLNTRLSIFPTWYRLIQGLKKEDDFETRLEKIRNFFTTEIKVERGYALALLGYYFDEADEI